MTTLEVSEAQTLREEIGRILSRDYPEFVGLESKLGDGVLAPCLNYLALCPSVPFLEYCSTALAQKRPEAAENRLKNILLVLPEVKELISSCSDLRERSAVVSLNVAVVNDMADQCLGVLIDESWEGGMSQWVRGSIAMAQHLPYLWSLLGKQERLRIYMALAGARGNIMGLIELCRERDALDYDFVKTYFENSSAPLRGGIL